MEVERPRSESHQPLKPTIVTQVEMHRSGRVGWLRAAVLGSDDAIVSTASLMIGVAAASASKEAILVAGVAGLVAGDQRPRTMRESNPVLRGPKGYPL